MIRIDEKGATYPCMTFVNLLPNARDERPESESALISPRYSSVTLGTAIPGAEMGTGYNYRGHEPI